MPAVVPFLPLILETVGTGAAVVGGVKSEQNRQDMDHAAGVQAGKQQQQADQLYDQKKLQDESQARISQQAGQRSQLRQLLAARVGGGRADVYGGGTASGASSAAPGSMPSNQGQKTLLGS